MGACLAWFMAGLLLGIAGMVAAVTYLEGLDPMGDDFDGRDPNG